jgi:uncharacterized lipoprotein YmbA
MTGLRRIGLAAAMLATLAGCGTVPPARLFTLTRLSQPTAPPMPGSPAVAIDVAPVHLAEYLDRVEIQRWIGPNELRRDDADQWAERLSEAMARTLAADLSILTGRDVRVVTDRPRPGPRLLVMLDVQRFDIGQDGVAVLEGRWLVASPGTAERSGGTLALRQQVDAGGAHPGVAAEVMALNHCFSDAAAAIAQGVGQVLAAGR